MADILKSDHGLFLIDVSPRPLHIYFEYIIKQKILLPNHLMHLGDLVYLLELKQALL